MIIEFLAGPIAAGTSPVARIVNVDALPADLDAVLVEGARASRFSGKTGQLHEGFVAAVAAPCAFEDDDGGVGLKPAPQRALRQRLGA